MMDKQEQAAWFETYLDSALKFPAARGSRQQAEAWARSMSLIAEQFCDNDDRDLAETE